MIIEKLAKKTPFVKKGLQEGDMLGHDIRNVLQVMYFEVEMLTLNDEDSERLELFHAKQMKLIQQIDEISRQLSPQERQRRELIQLETWIPEFLKTQGFNEDIRFKISLQNKKLPEIPFNTTGLGRLIRNLCKNSMDAYKEKKIPFNNRVIDIRIGQCKDLPEIFIEIEDKAGGIEPTLLPRVLHGGFTTKRNGSGTGIPSCREILREHQGFLNVMSDSIGTTWTCYLPIQPKLEQKPEENKKIL